MTHRLSLALVDVAGALAGRTSRDRRASAKAGITDALLLQVAAILAENRADEELAALFSDADNALTSGDPHQLLAAQARAETLRVLLAPELGASLN